MSALLDADVQELARHRGIGASKASRLVGAVELGKRCLTRPLAKGKPLLNSRDVDAALRPRLAREPIEHFIALPLDARNRPVAEIRVARGGVTGCGVQPADVFRGLIRCGAVSVILVHNHPSGNPEPSDDDIALTRRLVWAGAAIGILVLDHVIIGDEGFYSFVDAGLLDALVPGMTDPAGTESAGEVRRRTARRISIR